MINDYECYILITKKKGDKKSKVYAVYKTVNGALDAIQNLHLLHDHNSKCLTCIDQQHIYETVLVNWEDGEYKDPDILERYVIIKRPYYERP